MNAPVTKIPVSLAFLALGIAGLAGLANRFAGPGTALGIDAIALLVLAILTRRIRRYRAEFASQMRTAQGAAVFAGFPYSLILVSGHLAPLASTVAFWAWAALSVASAVYLLWFTVRFAVAMETRDVDPSLFVPYCAVGVVTLSSRTFGVEPLRAFVFLFVLVGFAILGISFAARLRSMPLSDAQAPFLAIACAPMSMAAVAYMSLKNPNPHVAAALVFLAQILFFLVLVQIPRIFAGGLRPAIAALAFPFAITATAAVDGLAALKTLGLYEHVAFTFFAYLETAFAAVMIVAILGSFVHFLADKARLAPKITVPVPCILEA